MLAEYLVAQGKFNDAWQAFREHFLADSPFDAFGLKQGWGGSFPLDPYLISNLVKEIEFTGIQYESQFYKSPEIQRRTDKWNSIVTRVDGRRFAELGPVADTLSNEWFKRFDDFSKLRVLVYYAVRKSSLMSHGTYRQYGIHWSDAEWRDDLREIQAALHLSPQAEAIWHGSVPIIISKLRCRVARLIRIIFLVSNQSRRTLLLAILTLTIPCRWSR